MSNNNNQSVTLQTAVLMQVREFANNNQQFSVHDITCELRTKTSRGEIDIPEVQVAGASFRYDIPHSKIKALFDELWRTGVFDPNFTLTRKFTGMFWEYTPSLVNNVCAPVVSQPITNQSYSAPTQAPITNIAPTPAVSMGKPTVAQVTPRIEMYLDNCANRNFRPTIKQVQSAIKRDVSTGWTCEELKDVIESLGYNLIANPDPDYTSALQVETI
jgi:hypothetical protein